MQVIVKKTIAMPGSHRKVMLALLDVDGKIINRDVIAKMIEVPRTTVYGIVRKLEYQGLAERIDHRRCKIGRPYVVLKLTDAGKAVATVLRSMPPSIGTGDQGTWIVDIDDGRPVARNDSF